METLQPAYLGGRDQFEKEEIMRSGLLSSSRSVVENVNARLKSSRLLYYTYSNKELHMLPTWIDLSACICNLYKPFRTDKQEKAEASNNQVESEVSEFSSPPRKFPLYLQGTTIPENCIWSFNKPTIRTEYNVGIVYKTFSMHSTSQLNKSALTRGRKYILSGKLSKIRYCTLERSFIAKASFSSSFKGQVNKEHKTFIEIGKGYIRGQCSCKNGKWKCAHQASLLFQTLCEMNGYFTSRNIQV